MAEKAKPGGPPPEEGDTVPEGAAATSVEAAPITVGMVLADRYELREVIGRGGMGLVFEAYDRVLGAAVAIKIVRAEYAGERQWAARLAREVKLARQIHHPNVCRVFDFEQVAGRAFLVMELAGQGTLRDEIAAGVVSARPIADRLDDARAVIAGLAAIHDAGIIHRDLAPQNLLRMSDGRLVISDFGLAIDAFESATSLRGGTVAYMAPEIVRGAAVSLAADVWSLGVVIHEVVFGERPRWRQAGGGDFQRPILDRRLDRAERKILAVCRACTEMDPGRRPRHAREVVNAFGRGSSWRPRFGGRARTGLLAACAAIAGAATLALVGKVSEQRRPAPVVLGGSLAAQPPAEEVPRLVPTGDPEDWTEKARLLAAVPERIHCLRALPDKRTVRFIWGDPGKPRHAEDLDTVTGHRAPSPLVSESYAEGCPDLSMDGRHVVYQGHTAQGTAYAFLSSRPDAREAVPVVQTGDPTLDSDPVWLPDGTAFVYEIDDKHAGIYWPANQRLGVVPAVSSTPVVTSYTAVTGTGIVAGAIAADFSLTIAPLSWPSLKTAAVFTALGPIIDVAMEEPSTLFYMTVPDPRASSVVRVDLKAHASRRIGVFGGQDIIRYPVFLREGMLLVTMRWVADVAVRGPSGEMARITSDGSILEAAPCAKDIIAEKKSEGAREIVRLDRRGRLLQTYSEPRVAAYSPGCSPDGATIYFVEDRHPAQITACDKEGCKRLAAGPVFWLAASPDGQRLLITTVAERGPVIQWMSSTGGPAHHVLYTETTCRAGWSGRDTAWVLRRNHAKLIWEEVNVDSGLATGRTAPGMHDCANGHPDPASPVDADVRIVEKQESTIRLVPRRYLGAGGQFPQP